MLSACLIVESLCAITTVVIEPPSSYLILSIAACTSFSFFLSRALVASSSRRILGFLMKALAMASLCFCPPDSYPPALPTFVSIPFSCILSWIKSQALADFKAWTTYSSEAWGLPYKRFSLMVILKSTGSCPTYPTCLLKSLRFSSFKSSPSTNTYPCSGS